MKRLVDAQLRHWKNSPRRKPLILRGARQIGKTWSVAHFGKEHFKHFVAIDFEKRPSLKGIFQGELAPARIVEQLELTTGQPIKGGESLLFLDEIQVCPRAITALRYFYEEMPELHVIAAGSLLEFAMQEISVPVGRVSYLEMFPLTFGEYLTASGRESLSELLQQPPIALDHTIHEILTAELKRFLFIGGMPECVAASTSGASLLDIFSIQDDLLKTYRDDFAKYGGRADKTCLESVLLHTARQVGMQIKYTKLDEGHSGQTNRKAFELLCMARVLQKIPSSRPAGLPLGASVNPKRFKASFLDVGLMQHLCGVPVDIEMQHKNLLNIYRGQLAEQFVAQELLADQQRELYYWSREERGSQAEVDYLIVKKGIIHPVEVKSGKGGTLRSLHLALQTFPDTGDGLVLYNGNYKNLPEQRIRFIPLYYAGSPQLTSGEKASGQNS